jgi:hypothetical protein
MFGRFAATFALAVIPATATAQAPRAVLPFITLDALVGGSSNPQRSGPTFYRSEHPKHHVARVAVAIRIGPRAGLRPVAVLDYSGAWGGGDLVTNCDLAPNFSCRQYFPRISGVAVGIGVRHAVGSRITVGVTGGAGRYTTPDPLLWRNSTGFHADVDLSLRFLKRAGVVLNVRHVEFEKFQGARMWYRPVTVGLRIQ